jgi:prepilin-type N-terminal cleavage/methylation domain-containing protein
MESNRRLVLAQRKTQRGAAGFTLVEVMIATLVLLIGLVAVARLVPLSINRNQLNRNDSKSTVVAEQVLDQILSQTIDTTTATINLDGQNFVIQTGGPGAGATGSPITTATGQVGISFAGAAVPGYNFVLFDPNNPSSPGIEVRLGVITRVSGAGPVSKRFVVGAWRRENSQNQTFSPAIFDGFQQR